MRCTYIGSSGTLLSEGQKNAMATFFYWNTLVYIVFLYCVRIILMMFNANKGGELHCPTCDLPHKVYYVLSSTSNWDSYPSIHVPSPFHEHTLKLFSNKERERKMEKEKKIRINCKL